MIDPFETGIEALDRWRELDAISARLVHGGALWNVKGNRARLMMFSSGQACINSGYRIIRAARRTVEAHPPRIVSPW